jgi:hypothetical protein
MLVGPLSNPAQLSKENDDILAMFNKIVTRGNQDVAVGHLQEPFSTE